MNTRLGRMLKSEDKVTQRVNDILVRTYERQDDEGKNSILLDLLEQYVKSHDRVLDEVKHLRKQVFGD